MAKLPKIRNFGRSAKKEVIGMSTYISSLELYNKYNKSNASPRSKAMLIAKLIEDGVIVKVDNEMYKIVNKKKYHIFRDYDGTRDFIDLFKEFGFDYIIYNSTFLNEWLNQLIGKGTIFIEADKKYLSSIYELLVDNGYTNILLYPTINEINKYTLNELIIIKPLFSRSPINRKEKSFTIEKVIVDLYCDSILKKYYPTSELADIYRQIFNTYAIDEFSLNAYLKRRNLKDRFYDFLNVNDLGNRIND